MRFNILLLDSHPVVRTGVRTVLKDYARNTYETSDGIEAWKIINEMPVDLVIFDVKASGIDSFEITKSTVRKFPKIKLLAYSQFNHTSLVQGLLAAGIHGYVSKEDDTLLDAVEKVMSGERYVSTGSRYLFNDPSIPQRTISFTRQELKIIALVASGYSSNEISYIMEISKGTVEAYRKKMIRKFKVTTFSELVDYAHRIGKL